jgi:hypothetical protein
MKLADTTSIEGEDTGEHIEFLPKKQRTGADTQPRKAKTTFDNKVGQQQLQRGLYAMFKALAIPMRSTAEFEESEFAEASKDLFDLVNRLPFLRIFFNFIAPLSAVVTLKDKVQRLIECRKRKQPESMFGPETANVG